MSRFAWPLRFCFSLLFVGFIAVPVMAQKSMGLEAGISASPDEFYVGGQVLAGTVAKNFWFRPDMEIGFGNSTTLVALNGDFVYLMDVRKSPWTVYFGGGPALNIATIRHVAGNHTDVGPGFNFLAGVRKPHGVFAEVKVGLMDSPAFKLGVGYTF